MPPRINAGVPTGAVSLPMSWLAPVAATAARVLGTRGAILCFHGIQEEGEPPRGSMHVRPEHFEAILGAMQGLGRLVSLSELVQRHVAGRSTAGLVALTFDDAYASVLSLEPLIRRVGVPLTLFAVSDALTTGARFWWDRVDELALRADLESWRRFEEACGLPVAYRRGQPSGEGRMRPLRQWVLAEHAGRWPAVLEEPLAALARQAGHQTRQRSMTGAELAGFVARTASEVGIHTVTHAALPFLPDHELVDEVQRGYEALRAADQKALPYLAIPYGLYDERTLRLVVAAGITPLTLEGRPLDRPYSSAAGIPRICVVRDHQPGLLALKASRMAGPLERLRSGARDPYPVLPSPTT